MKDETIKVLIVPPHELAYEAEIPNTLKSMQNVVGGYIEPFYYYDDVCLVCNEEGKINGLPLSRAVHDDNGKIVEIMAGTFFICGNGKENFTSLSPGQVEKYMKMFRQPEDFFKVGNTIISVPYDPTPKKPREPER